jgi:NADP-dependent 3-hydroxy acid dehydrogenase YdfG
MRLAEKVAVITGAASGIGLAVAARFAAEGAAIIAGDWNAERLDAAVETIRAAGGAITGQQGSIAERGAAEDLVDLAVTIHGRLDILCNNAGVMDYMQGVGELDDEVWRRVLSINLDGSMFTSRRAVQQMLEQGAGSIINIASIGGLQGGAAGAAYTGLEARSGGSDAQHRLDVRQTGVALQRHLPWRDSHQYRRDDAGRPPGPRGRGAGRRIRGPDPRIPRSGGYRRPGPLPGIRRIAPHQRRDYPRRRWLDGGIARGACTTSTLAIGTTVSASHRGWRRPTARRRR